MRLLFMGPHDNLAHDTESKLAGRLMDVECRVLPPSNITPAAVERAQADLVIVALHSDEATREACRLLRNDGRTARLPLVGVLARPPQYGGGHVPSELNAVMLRPVLPEDVVRTVRAVLAGRPQEETMHEAALSSALDRAILEAIPVAALAVAPDNTILRVNRAFEQLVGRQRSEVVGLMPWTRFIHAEDTWWRSVNADFFGTRVCRITTALGEERTVQATLSRIGLAGDWVVTLVDITTHHETDALLRVSEARYRTTLESINLGYFEVDLAGRLLFVNSPLCRALGVAHVDLISRQVMDYAAPSAKRRLQILFGRVMRDGITEHPARIEMLIDGKQMVLELAVTLMADPAGTPKGFRGLARDVTDQLEQEEEQRNIERLQGVMELAGAVCHELNQPLQSILGHSELLQMEMTEDDPTQDRIGKIAGQVERMREITAKLMNITHYRTRYHFKGARIIDLGLGLSGTPSGSLPPDSDESADPS